MTTAYGHDDDRREEGMAQEDIKRDSKIRRRRYASIQSVTIVPSFMDSFHSIVWFLLEIERVSFIKNRYRKLSAFN